MSAPSDSLAGGHAATPAPSDNLADGRVATPAPSDSVIGGHAATPAPSSSLVDGCAATPAPSNSLTGGQAATPAPSNSLTGGQAATPAPSNSLAGGQAATPAPADSFQAQFGRRWGHLTRPHVRALAWLLDAPDLLDPHDPHWQGKIASLGAASPAVERWLTALDADPTPLDLALGGRSYTRLGLYAEKLLAFYFREHGQLVAHGLQVRANRNDTVGEFDFLLDAGPDGVEHLEFATKFYLLEGQAGARFDTFVGPNLADSLGAKMRKIVDKQLALASHPAAQAVLPRPVLRARALVKGWLFYPAGAQRPMDGIAARHCRGFWCALADTGTLAADRFVVLPRLEWLAPFRAAAAHGWVDRPALRALLAAHFDTLRMPVLVAAVREQDGLLVEVERGFIVPDDWRARAALRAAA